MSKSHTPGPWIVHDFPYGTGTVVVTNPPKSENDKFVGHVIASRTTCPDWEANARLIAAAPELLEACARFIQFGKAGGDTSWHSDDAQSIFYQMMRAVGKATDPNLT